MASYSNFVELVLERVQGRSEQRVYTFLGNDERESLALTYGALATRAQAAAVSLKEHLAPGDRAVLVYKPGGEFITAFLACLFAGAIAVPVYPPRRPEDFARFAAIVTDSGARVVCTDLASEEKLRAAFASSPDLSRLIVVATDAASPDAASDWRMPQLPPEQLAFLQYTSGSTGTPKGVMVSHANLLHNQHAIQRGFGTEQSSVIVSWLPQYHDMGLIGGILHPLYLGAQCVLMSPLTFLQQPLRWLRAITKYRGTTSGAPNFAYDLCASRVSNEELADLDLASWSVAFNGAEPVRLATLERFAGAFARAGFCRDAFFPCYGLAEGTLYVTGGDALSFPRSLHVDASELERNVLVPMSAGAPGSRALVGSGTPVEQIVRIVHPTSQRACEDGQVGEIWVQGASVARGYWSRAEATREAFEARVAGATDGLFLRTGDLGVVVDGELYVTGRLKELIIIDGRNHYPHDIEETVQSKRPALRAGCGAAFSVDIEGAERLVVVQEVKKGPDTDLEGLAADIRADVAQTHGIAVHSIAFVAMNEVQKTSSGKIRRRQMRERYQSGSLKEVFRSDGAVPQARQSVTPSRTELEAMIASLVAHRFGLAVHDLDVHASFSSFGLDSRALVGLSGELETKLGRRLEPQIFYNYASIAALARFLSGGDESSPSLRAAARDDEPIAIVGMACRFPGAPSLDAFWELLQSGKDAITEVPEGRWDLQHWFDPDPSTAGKMATRWGGFIEGVDTFDADFFGISPREAELMDPQQRLMMQLAWHALEDAGVRPKTLRGSRTGVFVGVSTNDYARLQFGTAGALSAHAGTGNALSIVANRLSYFFDLRGPSLAVDTACSSSLTAVHQAALHLKSGECDAAIVGGINLLLSPDLTVGFSQNRMMASDGRCKTFSKDADGYVRSEGAGVVVLKRLSDALAAGDRVWAVVAGSACNQDGRSNGLTAPNGLAQRAVLRDALASARWKASDVQVVETHGTGTRLGDPIEAEALGAVYGEGREASAPLILGAVKSQIGHLEAAAGMAGLIKAALCLRHGAVPANIHAAEPNPLIQLDSWRLALPREAGAWPAASRRRAGVSAFGFGGANAHVLLEQADDNELRAEPSIDANAEKPARATHVLAFSARSETALTALTNAYSAALSASNADQDLAAICRGAHERHSFRDARRAVAGASAAEILAALAAKTSHASEERRAPPSRGVAFLFTGQGAQYAGMGRGLYETHPEFRAILDRCDAALRGKRAHGLLDLLYPPSDRTAEMDARLARTEYTQPALYCLEYALAKLWLSWGVSPSILMGHSLGEFTAAAIAGVFEMEEGLALVEARGRLMEALPEAGGMLAVFAHERDLDAVLARFSSRVSIGAFNGPGQMVLSGAIRELEKVNHYLQQHGIQAKPLKVSHAFHSPLMLPMADDFRRVAESIRYRAPSIPIVSNLTGKSETSLVASAEYWVKHVTAPVRFAHGVESLARLDVGVLLEIGPRPVLLGMARRMLPDAEYVFQPSLDAAKDDWRTMGEAVASLHESGVDIDWAAFEAPFGLRRAQAPLYPFDAKRFWFEAKASAPSASGAKTTGTRNLLGNRISSPRHKAGEHHFENEIHCPGPAFHRLPIEPVQRRVSLMAYVEMALDAQHRLFPQQPRGVRSIVLERLLQVPREESRTVQTICETDGNGDVQMEIFALESEEGKSAWHRVARARFSGETYSVRGGRLAEPLLLLRTRINEALDVDAWYESTRETGLAYCASPYPSIRRLWWAPGEVLAEATPREEDDGSSGDIWLRHSLWNTCNQILGAICPRDGRGTYFPIAFDSIRFYSEPGRAFVLHGRLREHAVAERPCMVDVNVYAEDGALVAMIEGAHLMPDETQQTPRAEWRRAAAEERPALLTRGLRRIVARAFKRPAEEIPKAQALTLLGLDSLTAMEIVTRVEQLYEVGIDMATLQQGATIEQLARTLGEALVDAEGLTRRAAPSGSPLVDLNRGDANASARQTLLFLVHPVGGSVFCYQELARHLGAQPLVAIQSPTLSDATRSFATLEAMAAEYVTLLRGRQASGPYRLGGWSMGGVLAFEMARQLEAAGQDVECLLLVDAMAPGAMLDNPSQGYALGLLAQSLGIDLGPVTEDDLQGDRSRALDKVLGRARAQGHALRALTHGELRRLLTEYERNLALLAAYEGQAYRGTATILRAETPLSSRRPEGSGHDWEQWLAGVDALHTVPGDHFGLLSGSQITLTASYVRRALKALPERVTERAEDRPLALTETRAARNVVIASPMRHADGVARAELIVDESHPYFFDHPLDHVSGILMLEGLLQLLEASGVTKEDFVHHLRLNFPRFCEKDRITTLEALPSVDGETRSARAVQDGVPVCSLKFHTDRLPALSKDDLARAVAGDAGPASARLLHKARAANVLIERWRVEHGVAETMLVEPPAGHLLAEGDARYHSPLYALEAVRQLVTGLAHAEYGVPQGWPMNLVGVELVLDAPLVRGVPITLRHTMRALPPAGASTFAHFAVELAVAGEPIGQCRLTAQLLTKEAYLAIRHKNQRAAA